MNYHIMVQDKFLDSFIDDVYAINEEASNVFWFRGENSSLSHVKTNHPVEFLGNDKKYWEEKLSSLKPSDTIFVHWYDIWISKLIYHLPNNIYVMLWGGEFYGEPFWYHQWLYDTLTLNYIKEKNNYPQIKFTLNIINLLKNIKRTYFFYKEKQSQYKQKNKLVGRIDYLISPTTTDHIKIKELYPSFKAININGFYDQNFDRAILQNLSSKKNYTTVNILLGNSAAQTNNHLDALEVLKKLQNITVYCPLSYGGTQEYVDMVITRGKQLFGINFIPILNFMTREEYMEFYTSIDIIYMFHNRQQAFGNICTALTMGKPVFLKNQNTLKGYLDAMRIKTYDVNEITSSKLIGIIKESKESSKNNYEILKLSISKEKRLSDLKVLFTEIKLKHTKKN